MGRGRGQDEASAPAVTAPRRAKKRRGRQPSPEQIARREAIEERIKKLNESITNLSPDDYASWLKSLPRFYKYSFNNYMLIMMQNKDSTRVATMKQWNAEGRSIKKGEHALFIFMPRKIKITVKHADGTPRLDEKGNEIKRDQLIFQAKPVLFDITQTHVTDPDKAKESENNPTAHKCISDLCNAADAYGVPVYRGGVDDPNLPRYVKGSLNHLLLTDPNAHGYYVPADRAANSLSGEMVECIVTRKGLTEEQEARVIAHELAHSILHRNAVEDEKNQIDRATKELEAEAVSFVVTSEYGLASDYSAAYIKNWTDSTEDDGADKLKRSSERIRRAVMQIFDHRDNAEQMKELDEIATEASA